MSSRFSRSNLQIKIKCRHYIIKLSFFIFYKVFYYHTVHNEGKKEGQKGRNKNKSKDKFIVNN